MEEKAKDRRGNLGKWRPNLDWLINKILASLVVSIAPRVSIGRLFG